MALRSSRPDRAGDESLIPDDYIDELLARVDLASIVARRLELKPSGGNNLKGLCPFHNEKSPSFMVSKDRNLYHCFGCGASGSALTFLLANDGMTFRDAIRELAAQARLALPPQMQEGQQAGGAPGVPEAAYQATETATKFFRHALRYSEEAKEYLRSRGITTATANRYRIGFAPQEWNGLREAFADYATNPTLALAGLVRDREATAEKAAARYDWFRSRIMFPIRDTRNRVVGFGGRILGQGEPKYLNSPQSGLFDKSSILYGFHEAKEAIRREKFVVVVEGYMDVVILAQHGIENVVATMGTAFSRAHAERLLTQTQSIVFAFDGDEAGSRACRKTCDAMLGLLTEEMDIRFMRLPTGQDPDELVRAHGASSFIALARQAPTTVTYLIESLRSEHDLRTPEGRARYVNEGRSLLYRVRRQVLRNQYLNHFEASLGDAGAAPDAGPTWGRPQSVALWTQLRRASLALPALALELREIIIECLDTENAEEMGLIEHLQSIAAGTAAQTDGNEAMHEDVLRRAVDLIMAHRKQQILEKAREDFAGGVIDSIELMRISQI